MLNVSGRRPTSRAVEIAIQEVRKVALGSSAADATPDDTPSRRWRAPAARASIYSSFRELPLMTPAHLAQPLPASAVSAKSSLISSPLGVTVAASQPCTAAACKA